MIDFHTSFQVQDIWTVLSESKRFKINEHSKGTLLPHFNIEGLKIAANVHHTDTVLVTVARSKNPISTKIDDVNGMIRLAAALARAQERIQRLDRKNEDEVRKERLGPQFHFNFLQTIVLNFEHLMA
jgi:hypothetical protein